MPADTPAAAAEALLTFVQRVEAAGLAYVVVGSMASSVHGEPRLSRDIDVVVAMSAADLPPLVASLKPDFYVPEDTAERAVTARSSFGLLHLRTMQKIDVFIAGDSAFDREQFEHRLRVALVAGQPSDVWILAPERLVVSKLSWYRSGGHVSEQQWRDVLGVLKVQGDRLDRADLRRAAAQAGVMDLLQSALQQAGLASS
jgi:hypothetical protein